jgi:hypothetical protein
MSKQSEFSRKLRFFERDLSARNVYVDISRLSSFLAMTFLSLKHSDGKRQRNVSKNSCVDQLPFLDSLHETALTGIHSDLVIANDFPSFENPVRTRFTSVLQYAKARI